MIEPLLSDDRLLEDVYARQHDPDQLELWWLGQSGFLLRCDGHLLLLDPYLSDSLTTKYAATDKPHVRMTRRVVDPARLSNIAAVTSSHNHTDHLDAETLRPLLATNPDLRIIIPAANVNFAAERLQLAPSRLEPIDAGGQITVGPYRLHAIPAAHESVDRDAAGRCVYLGYVVECGPWAIYHSGDTIRYDEQLSWLSRWSIDVALLPINGRAPERRVAGNLWGREAAELAHEAHIRCVIPCHYEMFEFNTATTAEFVATCEALGQKYCCLRAGQRWSTRQLAP